MGGPDMAPQAPHPIEMGGPDMAPHTPHARTRPGKPGARLDHTAEPRGSAVSLRGRVWYALPR